MCNSILVDYVKKECLYNVLYLHCKILGIILMYSIIYVILQVYSIQNKHFETQTSEIVQSIKSPNFAPPQYRLRTLNDTSFRGLTFSFEKKHCFKFYAENNFVLRFLPSKTHPSNQISILKIATLSKQKIKCKLCH